VLITGESFQGTSQLQAEDLQFLAVCRRERRHGRSRKEMCLRIQKIAVKVA
jgi:hypothetical protein